MRIWISESTANGLVTRQLHWLECLSDHGKKVQSTGAGVIAFACWLWAFADLHSLPAILIVWLIAAWIWKRIMLAHFPRQFAEEPIEPAAPPKCPAVGDVSVINLPGSGRDHHAA
jgi:hypothetical protein